MVDAAKVLLICDDNSVISALRQYLTDRGGFSLSVERSGNGGISVLQENTHDVILVRFSLFDIGNKELISGLKKVDPDCIIIAYLEEYDPQLLKELVGFGVYDFVAEPLNLEKLLFLIKKGTQLHSLLFANHKLIQGLKEHNVTLEKQNILLAKRIEESTKNLTRLYEDLHSTYLRTIKALAQAIDARDHYTHSHSENVARYAEAIAREMGLPVKEAETIREACELHDLGKIGIDDSILSKPSTLNKEEWEQIKRHPVTGAQILEPLTFLNDVIVLVRQHHEHYDGSGYPEGRKGEDILLGARIIHLSDAYEAMRSARSYRKEPLSKEAAIAEIKKNSGRQFDPRVVAAFLKIVDVYDPG
ncbi:MAG: HD domain-containing protein [Candidatus Omnitrophica bacterium]|nr:HD domain-containing protein [Candidatus Omnitrophota bacterium]MBL7210204.1 HD domain-containing protein [Candidatus Omnitrophota bacterium]